MKLLPLPVSASFGVVNCFVTVFLPLFAVAGLAEVLVVFSFLTAAVGVKITPLCLWRGRWGKRNELVAFICSPCRKMLPVLMGEEQPCPA